jgi:glutathione S-transferase
MSNAAPVFLFGARYSVYTRIARLVLEEKGVGYELVEVDVFAPGGPPPEHLARHPFGRIPALRHDGVTLYEAGAIARYVDEVFAGPALQPSLPLARARMAQLISILDSYAFRPLVLTIYVERVSRGEAADEAAITAARPQAERVLGALESLMAGQPFLAGPSLSLADLHAAPMIAYFRLAPEGAVMLARRPALTRWWQAMAERASMASTRFPAEADRPP